MQEPLDPLSSSSAQDLHAWVSDYGRAQKPTDDEASHAEPSWGTRSVTRRIRQPMIALVLPRLSQPLCSSRIQMLATENFRTASSNL